MRLMHEKHARCAALLCGWCVVVAACSKQNEERVNGRVTYHRGGVEVTTCDHSALRTNDTVEVWKLDTSRVAELVEVFASDAGLTTLWRTLPYDQRLKLALQKMRTLPKRERMVFANWCLWNDPRVGFVVHTNLAATLPHSAATMRGELLCDAACCLAALQHYDEAWSFAMTELNKDDVLECVPRAALLLADVAQARQDSGNEVSYAHTYLKACKGTQTSRRQGNKSVDAAIRYAIALCHARQMQRLREFAAEVLASEEGLTTHERNFFTSLRDNATEVLESRAEWTVRYTTRCWPTPRDVGGWPAE